MPLSAAHESLIKAAVAAIRAVPRDNVHPVTEQYVVTTVPITCSHWTQKPLLLQVKRMNTRLLLFSKFINPRGRPVGR
jgi:hypothetical protein